MCQTGCHEQEGEGHGRLAVRQRALDDSRIGTAETRKRAAKRYISKKKKKKKGNAVHRNRETRQFCSTSNLRLTGAR